MTDEPWPPRIGAPAILALAAAGIDGPEALGRWRRDDLSRLYGIGPRALGLLEADLRSRGLRFAEA